jgi:hypothetical protein
MFSRRSVLIGGSILAIAGCSGKRDSAAPLSTQLNWLHDPTFAAHYRLADWDKRYSFKEGGPSVFPIQAVANRLVDASICGFDIFAKFVAGNPDSDLRAVFCDFQRNPVGWILHSRAAAKVGVDVAAYGNGDVEQRNKLLGAIRDKKLRVGDKVGTETTAILRAWLRKTNLSDTASVVPVGFDASLVQDAPPLLFPVYLNEEPFRISEKIGPLLVVDPVSQGVSMLGNIVVMRGGHDMIGPFREGLADAWRWVRDNVDASVSLVGRYYKAVSPPTLKRQIEKTVEFAFQGGEQVGEFDLARGGRVDRSLEMLHDAQAVPIHMTFEYLSRRVVR